MEPRSSNKSESKEIIDPHCNWQFSSIASFNEQNSRFFFESPDKTEDGIQD